MKKLFIGSILLGIISITAQAACQCACVSNQKQWVCSNSWDVPVGFCGGPCYGYKSDLPTFGNLSPKNQSLKSDLLFSSVDKSKFEVKK